MTPDDCDHPTHPIPMDWHCADDLLGQGYDPDVVAWLRRTTGASEWHRDVLPDLVWQALREMRLCARPDPGLSGEYVEDGAARINRVLASPGK